MWNALPYNIHAAQYVATFRKKAQNIHLQEGIHSIISVNISCSFVWLYDAYYIPGHVFWLTFSLMIKQDEDWIRIIVDLYHFTNDMCHNTNEKLKMENWFWQKVYFFHENGYTFLAIICLRQEMFNNLTTVISFIKTKKRREEIYHYQ